ncbi:MAG: CvpA family protein [bacterium]
MTSIDYIILAVIAAFTLKGLFRGIINETIGLIALVVSLVVATKYMSNVADAIDNVLSIPPAMITVLAFLVIFISSQLCFQLVSYLLHQIVKYTFAGWLERLAGGGVGLLKGLVVASLVALLLSIVPFSDQMMPQKKDSLLFNPVKDLAPKMFNLLMVVMPHSKSFSSELKESLENLSGKKRGNQSNGLLRSLQDDEDPPKDRSQE